MVSKDERVDNSKEIATKRQATFLSLVAFKKEPSVSHDREGNTFIEDYLHMFIFQVLCRMLPIDIVN